MLLKELYSTDTKIEQALSTILPIFKEQGEKEAFEKASELYGKEATRIIGIIKKISKNNGLSDVEKEYKSKGLTPSPEVVTW